MRHFIAVVVAVLAVTFSARAAIVAGPEREVATPSIGLAYGTHTMNAVASDGQDFLVAWSNANGTGYTLYLSVVGPDGTPKTNPSQAVRINAGRNVSMVWTGNAYLVAWNDERGFVEAARVTADGQFDGVPALVSDSAAEMRPEALAWDGHRALIAYRDNTTQRQRFALLDDHAGVVRNDFAVQAASVPSSIIVSAAGDRFLVIWAQTGNFGGNANTSLFAVSVDNDGNAAPSAAILASNLNVYISGMSAAADGARVAVGITTQTNKVLQRYYVTPSTLAVEALPQIAVSSGDNSVRLVHSGSEVLAYWPLFRDGLYLETMSFATGTLRESRVGTSGTFDLRAASNGDSLLAVWSDRRVSINFNDYSQLLNAALLDASGATVRAAGTQVALSPVSQGMPALASAGAISLVAWVEQKETVRGDLMVRRVDSRGVAIDPTPVLVEKNVPAGTVPVVGFTGQLWIVAYAAGDASHYAYRRVTADGHVVDAVANELGLVGAAFAANAKTSVLVGGTGAGIAAVRFTPAGDRIDAAPLLITTRIGYLYGVAASDDEFLAVWGEGSNWWQFPSPNLRDVYGARLDLSGAPIDSAPIAIAAGKTDEANAAVASNGHDFIVAYIENSETFGAGDLRLKSVLHEGIASSNTAFLAGKVDFVNLVRSNGRYFVAYDTATNFPYDASTWIATIDDAGTFIDGPSLIEHQYIPMELTPTPSGALLGYRKAFDAGATRALVRSVTAAPSRNRGARH